MFSLSHVAAFIEVIETGSFHEASRRLQISQPTVSHNVKRLEDILGGRLVEEISGPPAQRPDYVGCQY